MTPRSAASRLAAVLAILLAVCSAPAASAAAAIELIGVGEIPGTASDGLVLDPPVLVNPATGEQFPHDRLGGMGLTAGTYCSSPATTTSSRHRRRGSTPSR